MKNIHIKTTTKCSTPTMNEYIYIHKQLSKPHYPDKTVKILIFREFLLIMANSIIYKQTRQCHKNTATQNA